MSKTIYLSLILLFSISCKSIILNKTQMNTQQNIESSSAKSEKQVELKDGEYNGLINGYILTVNKKNIKLNLGFRGLNIKCTVVVKQGVAYVFL